MKSVFKASLAIIIVFSMILNNQTNTNAIFPTQVITNGDFTTDLSGWTPSVYSYSGSGTWVANVTNNQALLYAYYGNNAYLTQNLPEKLYPISIGLFYERLLPNTCNSVSFQIMNGTSILMGYHAGGDNWNHNDLNYLDMVVDGVTTTLALTRPDLQSAYLRIEFNYNNNSMDFYAANEFLGNVPFSSPNSVYGDGVQLVAANPCYGGRNEILGHFDDVVFYGMNAAQMAIYTSTHTVTQTSTATQTNTVTTTTTQNNTVTETTTQNNTVTTTETQNNTITETQTGGQTVTETQVQTVTQNVTDPGSTTTYTEYNATSVFYVLNSTETKTETKTVNVTETSVGPSSLGGRFIIYTTFSSLMILVYTKSRIRFKRN